MFSLFNALDSACGLLPAPARLGFYGLVIGALAMLIYRWLSPQTRLIALKQEMADARRELRAYNGTDGVEILRLSKAAVGPALRQLLLVLGPTLVAMAPVLLIMWWLQSAYTARIANGSGPAWLYYWETPFMVGLTISALAMKFALKIV